MSTAQIISEPMIALFGTIFAFLITTFAIIVLFYLVFYLIIGKPLIRLVYRVQENHYVHEDKKYEVQENKESKKQEKQKEEQEEETHIQVQLDDYAQYLGLEEEEVKKALNDFLIKKNMK